MKKNLLSIIILSLLVVNIILTVIMMMNVMGTNQKTAAIVTDIAGILDIELDRGDGSSSGKVSLEDTVVYAIPEEMKIPLKKSEGDDRNYICIVKVSFSLNSKHEAYAKYGDGAGDLSSVESILRADVNKVIGEYTVEEAELSQDEMCEEILKLVQEDFDGYDFIYKVSFSDILFSPM